MNRFTLLLFFLLLFSQACQNGGGERESSSSVAFEEFLEFYDRFHQDSSFQVSHIRFPLSGLPANADSATLADQNFTWSEQDWVLMQDFDTGSGFERTFTTSLDDQLIIETIGHQTQPYGIERRWLKQGGDWYLIYYSDLNPF